MAVDINISEIFYKAFGYEMPERKQPDIDMAPIPARSSSLGQAYYAYDGLSMQHFTPVFITVPSKKEGEPATTMLIPFAVINITAKKTIVGTPLPERGGTVHELISIDDYVIGVKGLFIRSDYTYPESEIIQLKDLYETNTSVVMRGVLPSIFLKGDWHEMVIIRDMRLNPIAGVTHAVPFEMTCESDMAFDLIIN